MNDSIFIKIDGDLINTNSIKLICPLSVRKGSKIVFNDSSSIITDLTTNEIVLLIHQSRLEMLIIYKKDILEIEKMLWEFEK